MRSIRKTRKKEPVVEGYLLCSQSGNYVSVARIGREEGSIWGEERGEGGGNHSTELDQVGQLGSPLGL